MTEQIIEQEEKDKEPQEQESKAWGMGEVTESDRAALKEMIKGLVTAAVESRRSELQFGQGSPYMRSLQKVERKIHEVANELHKVDLQTIPRLIKELETFRKMADRSGEKVAADVAYTKLQLIRRASDGLGQAVEGLTDAARSKG